MPYIKNSLTSTKFNHYAVSDFLVGVVSIISRLTDELKISSYPTTVVLLGYPNGVIASTGYCFSPVKLQSLQAMQFHWELF